MNNVDNLPGRQDSSFLQAPQLPSPPPCPPQSFCPQDMPKVPRDPIPRTSGPHLDPPSRSSSFPSSRSHNDASSTPLPFMTSSIKYRDLHSLPAYSASSTSRLKSLYSDVSRQKHSNPAAYRSTVHWWRGVLQTVVLKHWLPQSSDTLVLHALPTLADSFRYEGAGKPLCLATVIVSSAEDPIFGRER